MVAQLSVTPSITVAPPTSQAVEVATVHTSTPTAIKPETPTTPSALPLTKARAGGIFYHFQGVNLQLISFISSLISHWIERKENQLRRILKISSSSTQGGVSPDKEESVVIFEFKRKYSVWIQNKLE